MKQMLYSLAIITAIVAIIVSGCNRSASKAKEAEVKIPVEVMTVKLGEVVQSLSYSGDIRAEQEVKVFSKIPDRIERFYVDAGDEVKRGAPIAKVVATTIEQGVRQAEAGLAAARAQEANLRVEFERAQRLTNENAMSPQQFDAIKTQYEAVKAQVEQAEAAVKSAHTQLAEATITAPISGVIGVRYFEAGDMASPAMPLVTVVQMDRVKITFNAAEEDLGKLALGQAARVTVKSYADRSFEGKVIKISPVLDPLTRMAEVEVLIDNPQRLLKPGMYAQVDVITGILKDVLVVPRFAVIENTTLERIEGQDQVVKNYYVFVVDSNKAHQKKLDVRYANHKSLAVNSGIAVGNKLVIAGQNNLRDGVAVAIAKGEEE
ncbi:MAG: efflux RND transporter periplasmic adaptor subunit [candidate division KSB1 bacterium]|nr:efflux RND transporter periplasmic adaptor subunit [candidate division KSB1 bacterium]MDZ7318414.1 efflux RND transporter periplasmic adaptor subunit [candidate division KSB1 bacterium]MDZ7341244.1 efflux RND transporter periplasmic adaptor subunit [candidate division KSB1 bacterium]